MMQNDRVAVQATILPLAAEFKIKIVKLLKRANRCRGMQIKYVDCYGASYLFTQYPDQFVVSVVDEGPHPNASILSFVTSKLGEPTKLHAKPWIIDNSKTIFLMFWLKPDLSWI